MQHKIIAVCTVFVLCFLISLVPVCLWYAVDDQLAYVLELPRLGHMPWYHVWLMWFLLVCTRGNFRTGSNRVTRE